MLKYPLPLFFLIICNKCRKKEEKSHQLWSLNSHSNLPSCLQLCIYRSSKGKTSYRLKGWRHSDRCTWHRTLQCQWYTPCEAPLQRGHLPAKDKIFCQSKNISKNVPVVRAIATCNVGALCPFHGCPFIEGTTALKKYGSLLTTSWSYWGWTTLTDRPPTAKVWFFWAILYTDM